MRRRLFLRVLMSVLVVLGLHTLALSVIGRRLFARAADAELLAAADRAFVLYGALAAGALLVVLGVLIERALLRPLDKLERDLERAPRDALDALDTIDALVAPRTLAKGATERSDVQRLQHGIARLVRRAQDDARELAEKEATLDTTRAQLTRAEQLALVGRMSAGLAHEIGNPLAAVIGYVSLIDGEADADKRRDLVARSERELERIHGLIRELLDYARPAPLKRERHSLGDIVAAATALLTHQPRGRGVVVESALPNGAFALVDRERTIQIILNIFLNAADAMASAMADAHADRAPRVTLTGTLGSGQVRIDIRDHGPGFSGEALLHAGEPFYTSKGPGQGTGLGLAVCKTLMHQQGGQLLLANHAEGGALVSLVFRA